MTEQEWDELKDRELDESLTALFKSVDAPAPLPGFASRTMKAVRREPLPAGRRRLAHPWTAPIGWAALIGARGCCDIYGVTVSQPVVAELFARLVAAGIRIGMRLMGFVGAAAALTNLLTATGLAIARAVATRDGSISLTLIVVVGALSLAALRRLLVSESEAPKWQELS